MKLLTIVLLFLSIFGYGQQPLDVTQPPFNASKTGNVDAAPAIQAAIDSAIKVFGTVYFPKGVYRIDKTLVVAKWGSAAYGQSFIKMIGEDMMHSPGVTIIRPTFKDAPALALHLNKGTLVKGLYFDGMYRSPVMTVDSFFRAPLDTYGDSTCRDSQYSPYCAIAIDPFRGMMPPDSGYPTLRVWYRGPDNVSGSTGVRIEDCTFKNFTIGAILSPNGKTLNNEIITLENIRVNDCKYAFVGCQAQEKGNRLINWEVWGKVKCVLGFAKYGQKQPGHYTVDGMNIAGVVGQFIFRPSQEFFPIHINGVFAESIGELGYWNTGLNDALSNSSFNFYYYKYRKSFPNNIMNGNGVTFNNVDMRYYVFPAVPLFFKGKMTFVNSDGHITAPDIRVQKWNYLLPDTTQKYTIKKVSVGKANFYMENGFKKVQFYQTYDTVSVGDLMVFTQGNYDIEGLGEVESIGIHGDYIISFVSPGINNTMQYAVGKYKLK